MKYDVLLVLPGSGASTSSVLTKLVQTATDSGARVVSTVQAALPFLDKGRIIWVTGPWPQSRDEGEKAADLLEESKIYSRDVSSPADFPSFVEYVGEEPSVPAPVSSPTPEPVAQAADGGTGGDYSPTSEMIKFMEDGRVMLTRLSSWLITTREFEKYDSKISASKPYITMSIGGVNDPRLVAATQSQHQQHVVYVQMGEDNKPYFTFTEVWYDGSHKYKGTFSIVKLVHLLSNMTAEEFATISNREG